MDLLQYGLSRSELQQMDETDIDEWLEAARLKKINERLELLQVLPYSNLSSKAMVNNWSGQLRKFSNMIKIGLGLNKKEKLAAPEEYRKFFARAKRIKKADLLKQDDKEK